MRLVVKESGKRELELEKRIKEEVKMLDR